MSRLLKLTLGAALGLSVSMPLYAADTAKSTTTGHETTSWSDSQISAAREKCNSLTGTEQARCIVNMRPAGGGGSSVATSVNENDENTVKTGMFTDEDYVAAVKHCDAPNVRNKERCLANVKDHFGRM